MSLKPKLTYRAQAKLEVFYTGGAARLSADASLLACACGDEVKLVDVATGRVTRYEGTYSEEP
jgi:U3 small nucleolar RNA-associated protein 13